jgi:hypothetical protein
MWQQRISKITWKFIKQNILKKKTKNVEYKESRKIHDNITESELKFFIQWLTREQNHACWNMLLTGHYPSLVMIWFNILCWNIKICIKLHGLSQWSCLNLFYNILKTSLCILIMIKGLTLHDLINVLYRLYPKRCESRFYELRPSSLQLF